MESVGVPGTPALLEKAHQKWGKKSGKRYLKMQFNWLKKDFQFQKIKLINKKPQVSKKYKITKNYFLPLGKSLEYGNIKQM